MALHDLGLHKINITILYFNLREFINVSNINTKLGTFQNAYFINIYLSN